MNIYVSKSEPYCRGSIVFLDLKYLTEDGTLNAGVRGCQISGLKDFMDIETAISDAVLGHIIKHRKDVFDSSNVVIL